MLTLREASERLQQAGIPPTLPRVAIARVLLSAPVHMTADQVYAQVHETASSVSRATVYNTLGLFCEKKLLRELLVDPQRVVYDSNTSPHFHLYNADTGMVTDIDAAQLQIIGAPTLPPGLALEEVDVIIRVRGQAG